LTCMKACVSVTATNGELLWRWEMLRRTLSVLLVCLLAAAWLTGPALAQDEEEQAPAGSEAAAAPEEATGEEGQGETGAADGLIGDIRWEEAAFVLGALVIVMGGLIGFEWVHRRRMSI